ncbi:flagellar basal body P-ring formation chaperone FlgA [Planktomarina sp.]|jgi:flagella basal body P-ring formation protein FlgA|nr:flagellar basal body P-ring formation chaperone FlgA [Planktomarina sp.]
MKMAIRSFLSLILISTLQPVTAETNIVYGADIEKRVGSFFQAEGIERKVIISSKRAYFSCVDELQVKPRVDGDWSTINVSCQDPKKWVVTLRTSSQSNDDGASGQNIIGGTSTVVFAKHNIPKGKVITADDLELKLAANRSAHGAYTNLEKIIGHKAKKNITRDAVLKSRHLIAANDIDKDDDVLIVVGAGGLTISTYGQAMEDGQVGEMIIVKNLSSNKEFKAIVLSEKKVRPLTNM